MKIRLKLNKESEKDVKDELTAAGIEISDDAQLILTEENFSEQTLNCKDGDDTVIVSIYDILFIESFGHDVFVNTDKCRCKTDLRLYQLEKLLPDKQFIRISNSVIIQRNSIKRIRPALSCKFFVTLKNGATVDVTRTYYYKFKEFYNI